MTQGLPADALSVFGVDLTFLIQTVWLLGKFGDNNVFGFARIEGFKQLLGEGSTVEGNECGFSLPTYAELVFKVFLKPLLIACVSLSWLEFDGLCRKITDDKEPSKCTGLLASAGRNKLRAIAKEILSANELDFLQKHSSKRKKDLEAGALCLWELCCKQTKKKLLKIRRQRIVLEVLMFMYMPAAQTCFTMAWCRTISHEGEEYSLSLADLSVSCSNNGWHSFARVVSWLCFAVYTLGFPVLLAVAKRGTAIKFDLYARVSNIFVPERRYWMAFLLIRRALLVFCYIYAENNGGVIYLPSHVTVDVRMLAFCIIVLYVAIQAHAKPYILPSDNALDQVVSLVLLLVVFSDVTLDQQISLHYDNVQLKHPIILGSVVATIIVFVVHKQVNSKGAQLAKVGLILTKKTFVAHEDESCFQLVRNFLFCGKGEDGDDKSSSKEPQEKTIAEVAKENQIDEDEAAQHYAAFHLIDEDGSGTIDRKELKAVLRMCEETEEGVDEKDIDKMMREHDDDDNDTLDFPELVGLLVKRQRFKVAVAEMTEAFNLIAMAEPKSKITEDSLLNYVKKPEDADDIMDFLRKEEDLEDGVDLEDLEGGVGMQRFQRKVLKLVDSFETQQKKPDERNPTKETQDSDSSAETQGSSTQTQDSSAGTQDSSTVNPVHVSD